MSIYKKKVIILLGPPGSGKGSVCQYLVKNQNAVSVKHFSFGSLCRYYAQQNNDLGRSIKRLIDQGNLVDFQTVKMLLSDFLNDFSLSSFDKEAILLLDGFPRNYEQALLCKDFYNFYKGIIEFYFFLFSINNKIIIKRLENRMICSDPGCDLIYSIKDKSKDLYCQICGKNLYMRPDDAKQIVMKRLDYYYEEEELILLLFKDYNINISKIDTDNNIDYIAEKLCHAISCF